ncbi:hypothetical protein MTBLM1_80031 [Rhodospirillaceae bacterium LM-1]|nr:hypothetical protein MTBLM1_80031 [Rhodospirillaceae bacterium LM-1]
MVRFERLDLEVIAYHETHTVHQYDWEVGFHCWMLPKGDYAVARCHVPENDIVDEHGQLLPELDWALQDLYIRIPDKVLRLASHCTAHQWLALEAMRHVPRFDSFLAQEIKGAGVNFILAVWELGEAKRLSDRTRATLNRRMMSEDRISLLRDLTGSEDVNRATLKLITKADDVDINAEFLHGIIGLSANSSARKATLALPRMSSWLLDGLVDVPPWLQLPALARIMEADHIGGYEIEEIITPVIRNCDEATQDRIVRSLSTAKTWDEVEDRLIRWQEKLEPDSRFPKPPIPGTDLLRPIRSIHELQKEGWQMCHCVGNITYVSQAMDGRSYFYRWIGEERATVELYPHFPTRRWKLCNALGCNNQTLKPETMAAIKAVLAKQLPPPPIDTYVAGAGFWLTLEERSNLRWNTQLDFRREPSPQGKEETIALYLPGGAKIGYLPKVEAAMLIQQSDQGKRFSIVIKNDERNGDTLSVSIMEEEAQAPDKAA